MKHSHYFKDVSKLLKIDVYRVLDLFNVTDPCLQHAIKKLLVPGGRGAGKEMVKDIQEAIDALERWKAMLAEEEVTLPMSPPPMYKAAPPAVPAMQTDSSMQADIGGAIDVDLSGQI